MADDASNAGGKPADDQGKKAIDLTPDEILKALEGREKEAGGVVALTGYVAESPEPDHIRLYFDLDLKSYCDIPVGEVVHRERFSRADAPNASRVFVRPDYKVKVVHAVEVEASFLQGGIAAAHPIRDGGKTICPFPVLVPQTIISQTVCIVSTTPGCNFTGGTVYQAHGYLPQTILSQTVCIISTTPGCVFTASACELVLSAVAPVLCQPK